MDVCDDNKVEVFTCIPLQSLKKKNAKPATLLEDAGSTFEILSSLLLFVYFDEFYQCLIMP